MPKKMTAQARLALSRIVDEQTEHLLDVAGKIARKKGHWAIYVQDLAEAIVKVHGVKFFVENYTHLHEEWEK